MEGNILTFCYNNNSFTDTPQGKYERRGVIWHNEKLNNKHVRKYVHENLNSKRKTNVKCKLLQVGE